MRWKALFLFLIVTTCAALARAQDLKLWYDHPAAKWTDALPVGSGRLGAMVFGGVSDERIQFNEDTLWTGKPHDYVRPGARDHLAEIQALVFAGKDKEKQLDDLVRKTFLSDPVRQKAYQPFGDLRLTFTPPQAPTEYRRQLDLPTAIASVTYKSGGVTYRREVFASHPDNVIVLRLTADKPGMLSFNVGTTSPHKTATTKPAGDDTLVMDGQVLDPKADDEPGMKFESRLRVITTGGNMKNNGSWIEISKADAATLLLVAATDFVNFQDITADPAARCEAYLSKLQGKDYETLRAAHVRDFQKLFGRVTLDLGRTDAAASVPTDERVNRARKAANPGGAGGKNPPVPNVIRGGLDADPALAALFFQYGRYLLIAASRPGTEPANLQGIWNDAINPPWESKYTTNINLEMNYWPAEVTGLSECAQPLFHLVDDLVISGGRTAREQYGARGWVLHHNTDLWRGTAPINNIDGVWPTGGAWLCYHLWEHYLFTGDKKFLADHAYPAMKGAAQFFVDFLVKDPTTGYLVTCPSFSPEQGGLCAGPAMDMQLIRALFDSTIEAANVLGVDEDFTKQLADVRAKLAPDRIGRYGQLQEWQQDIDQPNNNHRHMSPLWGLYPGAEFTPLTPKLFDAAKVLLKWRGDGSTGWSYAWRTPLWARVGNAEMAYRQLSLQIGKRTLPNLFDLCGPFQIDGNFGATAGIAEMLLQSHVRPTSDRGVFQIELLPALPQAWPKGSVTGLRARGGFDVSESWDGGKLTTVAVKSTLGNACKIKYGQQLVDLKPAAGETINLDAHLHAVK